jgi:hypothetical protein
MVRVWSFVSTWTWPWFYFEGFVIGMGALLESDTKFTGFLSYIFLITVLKM